VEHLSKLALSAFLVKSVQISQMIVAKKTKNKVVNPTIPCVVINPENNENNTPLPKAAYTLDK